MKPPRDEIADLKTQLASVRGLYHEAHGYAQDFLRQLDLLKEQHKECDERLLFAGDTCRELQYRVKELEAKLAEANRCWQGALEAQAELEADIAGLRQTIARQVLTIGQYQELRHKCPHPCDSCKEFERSAS